MPSGQHEGAAGKEDADSHHRQAKHNQQHACKRAQKAQGSFQRARLELRAQFTQIVLKTTSRTSSLVAIFLEHDMFLALRTKGFWRIHIMAERIDLGRILFSCHTENHEL